MPFSDFFFQNIEKFREPQKYLDFKIVFCCGAICLECFFKTSAEKVRKTTISRLCHSSSKNFLFKQVVVFLLLSVYFLKIFFISKKMKWERHSVEIKRVILQLRFLFTKIQLAQLFTALKTIWRGVRWRIHNRVWLPF